MAYTSLDFFKWKVRANDYSEDDQFLAIVLDAAEKFTIKATNRSEEELVSDGQLPSDLQIAVVLLGGHWLHNGEAVSPGQQHTIPMGFDAIVKPYRKLVEDKE